MQHAVVFYDFISIESRSACIHIYYDNNIKEEGATLFACCCPTFLVIVTNCESFCLIEVPLSTKGVITTSHIANL